MSEKHEHNHNHPHKHTQKVVNRLARIEGHVRSIKDMTRNGRDCSEVLLQIAAVRKALDNTAKLLLKDHLEGCVVEAVHKGNEKEVLSDLHKALDHYLK